MKIAIPTMDGTSISGHFGRSKAFLVFETDGGVIKHREQRENLQHHGEGHACKGGHHEEHGHLHDHGGFTQLLGDCQAVIVRGMGAGAAQAMSAAGIRVFLTEEACTPEEAVARLAAGRLLAKDGGFCACQH